MHFSFSSQKPPPVCTLRGVTKQISQGSQFPWPLKGLCFCIEALPTMFSMLWVVQAHGQHLAAILPHPWAEFSAPSNWPCTPAMALSLLRASVTDLYLCSAYPEEVYGSKYCCRNMNAYISSVLSQGLQMDVMSNEESQDNPPRIIC